MTGETLSKKLEDKLVESASNWLEYEDGEVYSDLVRKSVRRNVHNDTTALNLIKASRHSLPQVTDLLIDNLYYKEIGYPMDRKKKSAKPKPKRCRCKK